MEALGAEFIADLFACTEIHAAYQRMAEAEEAAVAADKAASLARKELSRVMHG